MKYNRQSLLDYVCGLAIVFAIANIHLDKAYSDWKPTQDLLLVTHSSPGTGNDLLLREYVKIWEKNKLLPDGVKAKVQNVRGGGGKKARQFVAIKHKGNPHLLWSYTPTQLIRPLIRRSDINHNSFTHIAITAIDPMILIVNSASPYNATKDLIGAIQKNPNRIKLGGGPVGSSASTTGEQIKRKFNLEFTYTPYKGGGEAVLQLLGNHIDFAFENPAEVAEHVKVGKLRILAATEKLRQFPNVPTFSEAGYSYKHMDAFRGIMMPPEVSDDVVAYYIDLFKRTQETKEWANYVNKFALNEKMIAGAKMTTYINNEAEQRTKVLQEIGMFKEFKKKKKK